MNLENIWNNSIKNQKEKIKIIQHIALNDNIKIPLNLAKNIEKEINWYDLEKNYFEQINEYMKYCSNSSKYEILNEDNESILFEGIYFQVVSQYLSFNEEYNNLKENFKINKIKNLEKQKKRKIINEKNKIRDKIGIKNEENFNFGF